jgi:prefoldin subunit 5
MNGYYAQQNATEALKLAKENAAELKATKDTLRTLIAWLEMELGSQNATTLLDRLSRHNAKDLARRAPDSE